VKKPVAALLLAHGSTREKNGPCCAIIAGEKEPPKKDGGVGAGGVRVVRNPALVGKKWKHLKKK